VDNLTRKYIQITNIFPEADSGTPEVSFSITGILNPPSTDNFVKI